MRSRTSFYLFVATVATILFVSTTQTHAADASLEASTRFITPDSYAAVVFRPQQVLRGPTKNHATVQQLRDLAQQKLGVDITTLRSALVFFRHDPSGKAEPDQFVANAVVVLRFAEPLDRKKILAALGAGDPIRLTRGQPYYRFAEDKQDRSMGHSTVVFPDAQTVILAFEPVMRHVLRFQSTGGHSRLAELVERTAKAGDLNVSVLFDEELRKHLEQFDNLESSEVPQLAALAAIRGQIESVTFSMNSTSQIAARIDVNTRTPAAAQILVKTGEASLEKLQEVWKAAREAAVADSRQVPEAAAIIDMLDLLSSRIRIQQHGRRATAQLHAPITAADFLELIAAIEALGTNAEATFADVAEQIEAEGESHEDGYDESYEEAYDESYDEPYDDAVPQE